jgi:hypothetical protein
VAGRRGARLIVPPIQYLGILNVTEIVVRGAVTGAYIAIPPNAATRRPITFSSQPQLTGHTKPPKPI